jgi:hypothetical protein
MWPFTRHREKKPHLAKKIIVGLVIGGAITSIIGKKLMEKKEREMEGDEKKK